VPYVAEYSAETPFTAPSAAHLTACTPPGSQLSGLSVTRVCRFYTRLNGLKTINFQIHYMPVYFICQDFFALANLLLTSAFFRSLMDDDFK